MARHRFGGVADYVISLGDDDQAVLQPNTNVTCWNLDSGGTQYTGLLQSDGTTPVVGDILVTDETGAIPEFFGPENVRSVYLDANAGAGPRRKAVAIDIGEDLTTAEGILSTAATSIDSHLSGDNPHSVNLVDLSDVDSTGLVDGQVLVYDSTEGLWNPESPASITDVVTLTTDQTIEGTKTFDLDDPNKGAIVLQCATGQVADLLTCFSETGQRTAYFNEKGELRVISAATNSVGVRIKGVSGQTAHVFEITDISNNPLAWYEPDGRQRGPNAGYVFPFSVAGTLTGGSGTHRIYNDTGVTLTVRAVRASVGTAPTGASVIVDVNKGGTTIFSTQANRPTIPAGEFTSGKVTSINTVTWEDGAYLTIDVDQIGSTVAGSNLTVVVWAY